MMKGLSLSGRILKKLKSSIPNTPYLKHHESALHEPSPSAPPDPSRILRDLPVAAGGVEAVANRDEPSDQLLTPMSKPRDFDEEDFNLVSRSSDKENSRSPWPAEKPQRSEESKNPASVPDLPSYRLPDLDSTTLFDPELLAAFEKAVMEHMRGFEEAKRRARDRAFTMEEDERGRANESEEPPSKILRTDEGRGGGGGGGGGGGSDDNDPLMGFVQKCPPGGKESVILYTTTLRGIRKTFEDCNGVRFLLESLKVKFSERDVSMHMEYREELWRTLEARAIPPRLFIRGRYVGGADEVLCLHEKGQLLPLLQEVPLNQATGRKACEGCAGVRFVVCWECNGSRKVYGEDNLGPTQCHRCNENGLVVCPVCC